MTWITEDPTILLILGGVTLVVLLAALLRTGRGTFLWAGAGVVAAMVLLILIERWIVTDREQIYDTLQAMAAALESGDAANVRPFIVPEATQMQRDADYYMTQGELTEVAVLDPAIEVDDSKTPPQANATFYARASGTWRGSSPYNSYIVRLRIEMEKRSDRWMMTGYKFVGNTKPPGAR